MSRPWGANL